MCLLTFVVVLVDKNSIQFSFSMHVTLNLCTQACGTHFEIHWNKIYHLMILQLFKPKDNNKKIITTLTNFNKNHLYIQRHFKSTASAFRNMVFFFFFNISICLNYLKSIISNFSMRILSFHLHMTSQRTLLLFAYLKYIFALPSTTLFLLLKHF